MEYIFRPKNGENTVEQDLLPKHQDTLKSSMVLIRRLLHDAQSKFRKMVEDNKKLAIRIDGSINAANQEVNTLRAELLDTNKKLTEISESSNQQECGTQYDDECKYTSYPPYVMMNVKYASYLPFCCKLFFSTFVIIIFVYFCMTSKHFVLHPVMVMIV